MDPTCAICCDTLVLGNRFKCRPCGHEFHRSCLKLWFENKDVSTCPTCRGIVRNFVPRKGKVIITSEEDAVCEIENGANLNDLWAFSDSPRSELSLERPIIHYATNPCMLRRLVDAGAELVLMLMEDWLHLSAERARGLIQVGFDVKRTGTALIGAGGRLCIIDSGWTVLHAWNEPEVARVWLDAGADVNAVWKNASMTPLHTAGDSVVVEMLIDRGADLDRCESIDHQTALHRAAWRLARKRKRAREEELDSPLGCQGDEDSNVGAQMDLEIIRVLAAAGARLDIQDREGRTPFHILAEDPEGLRVLTQAATSPISPAIDLRDKRGRTALHYAATHPEAASVLLEAGADPTTEEDTGCSPL